MLESSACIRDFLAVDRSYSPVGAGFSAVVDFLVAMSVDYAAHGLQVAAPRL